MNYDKNRPCYGHRSSARYSCWLAFQRSREGLKRISVFCLSPSRKPLIFMDSFTSGSFIAETRMARKIVGFIKLQVPAEKAIPRRYRSPALGQQRTTKPARPQHKARRCIPSRDHGLRRQRLHLRDGLLRRGRNRKFQKGSARPPLDKSASTCSS